MSGMRSHVPKSAILALLVITGAGSAWGLPIAPKGPLTLEILAPYGYWLGGLIPSGAGAALLYRLPRLFSGGDTILEEDIAAGWQSNYFYRNPDGTPYNGANESPTLFDQAEIVNSIGVRQGIGLQPQATQDSVEGFLFFRLHYDHNFASAGDPNPLVFQSSLPDRVEVLGNSVHIGMAYDSMENDAIHGTVDGTYAELSLEWGPRFLLNADGSSDFYRINGTVEYFRTLFRSPRTGERNFFSIYAADYLAVDYLGGGSIPIYAMESFGGRCPRTSVDTMIVRGFEPGRLDADLKVLNQLEIRICGPSVAGRDFVPGIYAFVDGAYCADRVDHPRIFASTGLGLFVDCFKLLNCTAYLAHPFGGSGGPGAFAVLGASLHLAF